MRKLLLAGLVSALIHPLSAGLEKATASWIHETNTLTPGNSLRTVITMNIDQGWHTYWENPGEGGLKPSLKSSLPAGWTIGEIQYPSPIRFMTGELHGFGYEGTVNFPVTITPPANFEGKIPEMSAKLSWLTCDDNSCLPGNANLSLQHSEKQGIVEKAYQSLPTEIIGAKLSLKLTESTVILKLTLPTGSTINPAEYELFPATEEIVDAATNVRFKQIPDQNHQWISTWPKNKYCETTPKTFSLLLKHPKKHSLKVFTK